MRSPSARSDASRTSLYGKAVYYAKQAATVILVHNPESLEEPADAPPPPAKSAPVGGTGLFGKKLRSAVDKLETARDIAKNYDAMFLLAQMNFVGRPSVSGTRDEG